MEFRIDFFFRIFMDLVYYSMHWMFFKLIFLHTSQLGDLNEQQSLFFIASFFLVDALHMSFVSNNLWQLPILINKGQLDYYLIRPVSPLFMLSLRDFAANSFINLLMALAFFSYALFNIFSEIEWVFLPLFLLTIINGAFLYYLIHLLFILPVFFTQSPRGWDQLFFDITRFLERPHSIFNQGIRLFLTFVFPLSLVVSLPVELLIQSYRLSGVLSLVFVSLFFTALVLFLWHHSLRRYTSASS